jgi:hypothetical protein
VNVILRTILIFPGADHMSGFDDAILLGAQGMDFELAASVL